MMAYVSCKNTVYYVHMTAVNGKKRIQTSPFFPPQSNLCLDWEYPSDVAPDSWHIYSVDN